MTDESKRLLKFRKLLSTNTMFRSVERRFRMSGSEGFNPRAVIDFDLIDVKAAAVNRHGVLKLLATIPAGTGLSKGPVKVSVGECVGGIVLKQERLQQNQYCGF